MGELTGRGVEGPDDLFGGDLLQRLERFAADARVDEAARQRARERWLEQQAAEDATFHGVLIDLAERSVAVTIHTRSGRSHRGSIAAVGVDFCAVRTAQRHEVLLAVRAISSVRSLPTEDAAPGDRPLRLELRLAELLADLVADRERALVVAIDGGEAVAGELRSIGLDVVTVRLDGEPRGTAYVPLDAIGEVSLVR